MEYEILSRIEKEQSVERICKELNIDIKTLYEMVYSLQESGTYLYPKICSNGEIKFSRNRENADSDVKLNAINGNINFLAISDLHLGSMYDDLSRLDLIQTFLYRNNINTLINMGDLIDGPTHKDESMKRRIPCLDYQINALLDVYPYISGPNICVLGDHDLKYRTEDGYNLNKGIKLYRNDIKSYSSGSGIIRLNGKELLICHDANDPRIKHRFTDDQILLSGHSHQYLNKTIETCNGPIIKIVCPSISNLPLYNNNAPGFLKFDFNYSKNQLSEVVIQNYTFINSKICFVGAIKYNMDLKSTSDVVRTRNK